MTQTCRKMYPKVRSAIVAGLILSPTHPAYSYSFDIGSEVELELHTKLQYDQYLNQNCSSVECDTEEDGFRAVDVAGKLKQYTGSHSLIFVDLGLDISNESTAIAELFSSESDNTPELDSNDDEIEQLVLGHGYRQHELTFGKHELKTKSFGPSVNNFLRFSLSGFDDDRIDWFGYKVEESFYASSSTSINRISETDYTDSLDINGVFGVGVASSDNSELSLDYDILFETTILGVDNVVLSIATRSLTNPISNRKLGSSGAKVNIFNNGGSEVSVGYTENDFGRYKELAISYIWRYRYKFAVGGTDFNTGSDGASKNNSFAISDAEFIYASFACAISEIYQLFVEYSEIDDDNIEIESALVGLKMSF